MLARSYGVSPTIVLMRIAMPNPSGYCGALSPMCHSGNRKSAASSTVAMAISVREDLGIAIPA